MLKPTCEQAGKRVKKIKNLFVVFLSSAALLVSLQICQLAG